MLGSAFRIMLVSSLPASVKSGMRLGSPAGFKLVMLLLQYLHCPEIGRVRVDYGSVNGERTNCAG